MILLCKREATCVITCLITWNIWGVIDIEGSNICIWNYKVSFPWQATANLNQNYKWYIKINFFKKIDTLVIREEKMGKGKGGRL